MIPEKSEAIPPWYFNRTTIEIEDLINKSIDLKILSNLWKNAKFHVEQVGTVYPPKTYEPPFDDESGGFLVYLSYTEIDSDDLKTETKFTTRKWFLEPNVSNDNIERTVYKLLENSLSHRLGEFFVWENCRIHSPHIELEYLIKNSWEYRRNKIQERYLKLKNDLKDEK